MNTYAEYYLLHAGFSYRDRYNMNEVLFHRQTYYVNIAAGVDLPLIIMMCVAMDEICHEEK